MRTRFEGLPHDRARGVSRLFRLCRCLSPGACLGGNGTLIGTSANLTVAGISKRNGVPFRFITDALYAAPMVFVSDERVVGDLSRLRVVAIFLDRANQRLAIGLRRPSPITPPLPPSA